MALFKERASGLCSCAAAGSRTTWRNRRAKILSVVKASDGRQLKEGAPAGIPQVLLAGSRDAGCVLSSSAWIGCRIRPGRQLGLARSGRVAARSRRRGVLAPWRWLPLGTSPEACVTGCHLRAALGAASLAPSDTSRASPMPHLNVAAAWCTLAHRSRRSGARRSNDAWLSGRLFLEPAAWDTG